MGKNNIFTYQQDKTPPSPAPGERTVWCWVWAGREDDSRGLLSELPAAKWVLAGDALVRSLLPPGEPGDSRERSLQNLTHPMPAINLLVRFFWVLL